MNDTFVERLIKRKLLPISIALRIISIVLIFVSIGVFLYYGIIGLLLEVVCCFLAYYVFKYTSVEFEYCYVTGEFVVDKIMGKAKRKRCIKVDMSTVELVAPIGHETINEYTNVQAENKNFASRFNPDKEYVMFFRKDTGLYKVIFEPDEAVLKAMQLVAPRKIHF